MAALSKEFLLARGQCCKLGCQECPWLQSLTNQGEKRKDIGRKQSPEEMSGEEGGRRAKTV